ncbi:MAG: putative Calcium-binding protein 39, partial [Streblomastix strix]
MIFTALVHREGSEPLITPYILKNKEILQSLLIKYGNADLALQYGMMLRECVRVESLAKVTIEMPEFYRLFEYVQVENFEIASDAFTTMKEILTRHKTLVAEFLQNNYEPFFKAYSTLLSSTNYATRRQSIK